MRRALDSLPAQAICGVNIQFGAVNNGLSLEWAPHQLRRCIDATSPFLAQLPYLLR